jgi:hypothetical protein
LVVTEGGELDRLVHVLLLLGLGVHLLLALLSATTQAKHEMQGALLLDVVVAQGAAILQLLAGEDQALLIGRDTFLVLDLLLHRLDGVGALHLEGDGLAREGLHENLHVDLVVTLVGVRSVVRSLYTQGAMTTIKKMVRPYSEKLPTQHKSRRKRKKGRRDMSQRI